jgi:hypothetical protein
MHNKPRKPTANLISPSANKRGVIFIHRADFLRHNYTNYAKGM